MASLWASLAATEDDLDTMADQQVFATPDNVANCSKFILNSLAGLGMSDHLNLGSSAPEDLAAVCNCLFTLIQQRQADRDMQARLEGLASKMRMDAQASAGERTRLEEQLQEKFTELGSLEIKLRTMQQKHRADGDAWARQADALSLRCKQAERREQQLENKLRQLALETEGLRDKLRTALQGKGGSRVGFHLDASQEGEGEGCPSLCDTAPAALGGAAGAPRPRVRLAGSATLPPSSSSSSSAAAATAAPSVARRSVRSKSAARVLSSSQPLPGTEGLQLQKLLEATEERAATLCHENVRLREQLRDMRTEYEQLLDRCEALGAGEGAAAVSTVAERQVNPRRLATGCAHPQQQHQQNQQQLPRPCHAAAAEALSSEELDTYLGTELKALQGRCRALLQGLAAKHASRRASMPPNSGPSPVAGGREGSEGGMEGAWDSAVADAELQEQLDNAQVVLQEQDKGLARMLVALHRAEAQRTAAQQRASAAQLRSVQLEKQLTAATQEQLASGEQLMELRARVYDLESQVARLQHLLGAREQEVERQQQQLSAACRGGGREAGDAAVLAQLRQDLAAAELRASEAQAAAEQQAAYVEAQGREITLVRRQLSLMTQAVAMTGGGMPASSAGVDAGVREGALPAPCRQGQQHQQHLDRACPAAAASRHPHQPPSGTAAVRDLSALLHEDNGYSSEGSEAGEGEGHGSAGMCMFTPEPEDPRIASAGTPTATASAASAAATAAAAASPVLGVVATEETPVQNMRHAEMELAGGDDGSSSSSSSRCGAGQGLGGSGGLPPSLKPFRLALHNLSGSGALGGTGGDAGGGGGSSRRHRQRWDMSPAALPAATPSPRQLLQESGSPSADAPACKAAPSTASKLRSSSSTLDAGIAAAIAANACVAGAPLDAASDRADGGQEVDGGRRGGGDARSGGQGDGGGAGAAGPCVGEAAPASHNPQQLTPPPRLPAHAQPQQPPLQYQLQERQHGCVTPHLEGATQWSSSPHTPQGSSSTSAASQATLGSFVTAFGGDTPQSTAGHAQTAERHTVKGEAHQQAGLRSIESGKISAARPQGFSFD